MLRSNQLSYLCLKKICTIRVQLGSSALSFLFFQPPKAVYEKSNCLSGRTRTYTPKAVDFNSTASTNSTTESKKFNWCYSLIGKTFISWVSNGSSILPGIISITPFGIRTRVAIVKGWFPDLLEEWSHKPDRDWTDARSLMRGKLYHWATGLFILLQFFCQIFIFYFSNLFKKINFLISYFARSSFVKLFII